MGSTNWMEYWKSLASGAAANDAPAHPRTDPARIHTDLAQWVSRGTPGESRARAAAAIADCLNQQASELNLGGGLPFGFGLKTLPDCVADLTHIRVLRLVGNRLTRLPEGIGTLRSLQSVYLFANRLRHLPESLCQCSALERLYVGANQLEALPACLGQLSRLRVLSAPGNRLTTVPASIGRLRQLRELYLFENPLVNLPDSFWKMGSMHRVMLGNDDLTHHLMRGYPRPTGTDG